MKFFFALLGVAFAAHSSLLPSRPFSTGKHYIYNYDAVLSSGLPVVAEGSVTRMQAEVHIELRSERSAVMQMKKIRLAGSHTTTEQDMPSMNLLESRELSSEHQATLELPVAFIYREGLVSDLQFSEEEEKPWSANIKRAVLNMLQMHMVQSGETNESNFYSAPEKTIEGECDVVYSVQPEKDTTIVTKSVNFQKCTRTAEAIYGRRFAKKTEEHQIMTPQTVYTFKIQKDEMKEMEVRSSYFMLFKDEPVMKTDVQARLTLVEVTSSRNDIEAPKGKMEDLIYSNKYEMQVEQFFKNGEEEKTPSPFQDYKSKVERATEIIESLKEMKESDPEMVHQMARLVRVFRMCFSEELKEIHDRLFKNGQENVKSIIEHALAIAGTKNTIEHLLQHVQDKEIIPIRAALLFKSIQETQYPSEAIADMLLKFVRSEDVRSEPILRQAAWLAFGSVVRGIVSHPEEKHLNNEDSRDLKRKYMDVMEKNWQDASETYEKILALKTIANSGLDIAVHTLEKIIRDQEQKTIIRVEAIQALRIMSEKMTKKVYRLLMPVFADRREKTEVRAAAFERLIYTIPEQMILSQIVDVIEKDPNHHLANYAYSFLQGIDKTSFPTEQHLINDVRQALKRINFRPKTFTSFFNHLPLYSRDWLSGAHINVAAIFGKDSIIPKDMGITFESMFVARWNQYLGQIGFSHQNLEQIINKVYQQLDRESSIFQGERAQQRVQQGIHLVKELAKKMNIQIRKQSSETPFAMVYFRYKKMDYAVLPINEQLVDRFVQQYIKNGKMDGELLEQILNGNLDFETTNAAFFFETTNRLPTTLGLPLTITGKMPSVFTSSGKIVTERLSYGARLRIQKNPMMTSTLVYQMRIWTPILEHGMKIVRPTKVVIPLDFDLEVTVKNSVSIALHMNTPEEKQTLIETSSHPIAFLRFPDVSDNNKFVDIEENTIVIPGWERRVKPTEWNVEIGGLIFQVSGSGYRMWTAKEHLFGEHNYHVTVEPTKNAPKNWQLQTEISLFNNLIMEKPSLISREEPKVSGEELARDLIHDVTREVNKGQAVEISGFFQTREKINFRINANIDNSLRFSRLTSDVSIPTSEDKWKWEQKVEIFLPRPVQSLEELKEKQHIAYVVAATQWGSFKRSEVVTKMILEQSPEMTNWMRSIQKQMPGMEEYELLRKTSVLNRARVASQFSLTEESQKFFEKLFDVLRTYGYWSSKIQRHQGKHSQMHAELVIEPATRRYVNVSIETPLVRLSESVSCPISIPLISLAKMSWMSPKKMVSNNAQCQISENEVTTFDEVVYQAPFTKCYSVVAKDCSEQARYAVLVKNIKSGKKAVKIVRHNNELVLEPVRDKIRVTRDNNVLPETEYEFNSIQMLSRQLLVVELQDITVHFDGETVKIQASSSQKNTQCGLCGHFNGDKSEIFRKADDRSTEDLEEFHRSFLLQDEECQIEEERLSKKTHYKVVDYNDEDDSNSRDEDEYGSSQTSKQWISKEQERDMLKKAIKEQMMKARKEENDDDSESRQEIAPRKVNVIFELAEEVCFSTEPTTECPRNTRPSQWEQTKVRFVCYPRHDRESSRLAQELRMGPRTLKVQSSQTSAQQMSVPTMCVVY